MAKDLSKMMMADLQFAEVTISGIEAVVAIGVFEGVVHAAAGETNRDALQALFRSVYPSLKKVEYAAGAAWSDALKE